MRVLPELSRRRIAAIGMKSLGGDGRAIKKKAARVENALRYAMSLGVCTTVSGIDSFAARAFCRHQASLEKATAIDYALSQLGVRVTEQYLPPSRILRLIGAIPAEV